LAVEDYDAKRERWILTRNLDKALEEAIASVVRVENDVQKLPPEVREHPDVARILHGVSRIETELTELRRHQEAEADAGRRTGRTQFWLGVLLGLPVGLLGTYLAGLLGIG